MFYRVPVSTGNFSYSILERPLASTNGSTRYQVASDWSSKGHLTNVEHITKRYKSFESKTNRVRIVTIEHGQYTYKVTKTFPRCPTGLAKCKEYDEICTIGVPATRYNKVNNTYEPERVCLAGLMIQLLHMIKNDLKFAYHLYVVKDKKYGGIDEKTGKWNGMIGDIIQGEADMAFATLTTTAKRLKVVDFSSPFGNVGIGLLMSAYSNGMKPLINFDFIHPFSTLLWTVIFVTIAVVLSSIWLLDKISLTSYLKTKYPHELDDKKRVRFLESMSYVWSTFVHVSAGSGLPRSESSRFVALFFAFAMIILSASYTAELAARKVKEEVKAPISGIFDDKVCLISFFLPFLPCRDPLVSFRPSGPGPRSRWSI